MRRLPIVSLARVGSKTSPHRKHTSNPEVYIPHAHVDCLLLGRLEWIAAGR